MRFVFFPCMFQIHAEVADFWSILEVVTAGRHAELLADLNVTLAQLSRRVEGTVSERLDISLQPVDISMRLPSAEQFHGDVKSLVANGRWLVCCALRLMMPVWHRAMS